MGRTRVEGWEDVEVLQDLDMKSAYKILNLVEASADSDAATWGQIKDKIASQIQGLTNKGPSRALADANVTLSGEQTVDGVALVTGDRVLLTGQTDPIENGIYVVDTGAWSRAENLAAGSSAANAYSFISEGTNYADQGWQCITDPGSDVVGTDSLDWEIFNGAQNITAGAGLSKTGNTVDIGDGSTGAIGGIDRTADDVDLAIRQENFDTSAGQTQVTLSEVPHDGVAMVYYAGLGRRPGATYDYTISGNVITFNFNLSANKNVVVTYFSDGTP